MYGAILGLSLWYDSDVLRLIKRHNPNQCGTASEADFKCKTLPGSKKKPHCRFTIIGPHPLKKGRVFKEKTGTSDERIATARLTLRETQFVLEPGKVSKPVKSLREATALFLATKKQTSPARQRMLRRVLAERQTTFLEQRHGVEDPPMTQIESTDLDEFVSSFKGKLSTRTRDRQIVKEFWGYCDRKDIIPKNIAATLQKTWTPRDVEEARNKPIPVFTPDEVARFFNAVDQSDEIFRRENTQDLDASARTRVLMYVIKFSGMAIVDVVTLRPSDLSGPDPKSSEVPISKERWKTAKIAHTSVPRFVWTMLQELPVESEYYFWSGKGNPESRVDTYRDRMQKLFINSRIRLFEKTGRRKSGGKLKSEAQTFWASTAIPHMWRHTLVRDLYLEDVPVRRIADILGDDPNTVTKYYSQFDELRRRQATATLEALHRFDPVVQRHMPSREQRSKKVLNIRPASSV